MFMPETRDRIVPGVGPTTAKIALIGDFTDNYDRNALKPFQGPAGGVLEACLHAAGLIRGELYLTNTIKTAPKQRPKAKNFGGSNWEFFDDKKQRFTELGMVHVEALRDEINNIDANVLIAAGPAAFAALSGIARGWKFRGYLMESAGLAGVRKVIPTASPASTLRGNYIHRHLIVADIKKAKVESLFPEFRRPQRQLVYRYDSVEEVLQWLEFYETQNIVATDIEVINFEISCISFASSPDVAVVVPIADRWTELEELQIWRAIQRVLGNEKSRKVLQNCIFDIQFMLTRNGIVLKGEIDDTMIAHSVMFPELPKGLGFLGSLHCGAQSYWKDTVKFNNIKEES